MGSRGYGVGADWVDGGAGKGAEEKVTDGLWGQGEQREGPGLCRAVPW